MEGMKASRLEEMGKVILSALQSITTSRDLIVHVTFERNSGKKVSDIIEIITELEAKYPGRRFYFDADRYAIVSEPEEEQR
ncbi:MAG: hypothetical protein ACP5UO_01800 [Thermoplasmata archaeon]